MSPGGTKRKCRPKFEDNPPADLIEAFGKSLTRMGGRLLDPDPVGETSASIRALLEHSRLVCSSTSEIKSEFDLATVVYPRELADVDHAVVRATCGVAETGSVLLTDQDLKVNALAYLAQHLIVLLDPADIVVNMHSAYARPEFRERRYAVFHSGPSATADIEGVLILGAQGCAHYRFCWCREIPASLIKLKVAARPAVILSNGLERPRGNCRYFRCEFTAAGAGGRDRRRPGPRCSVTKRAANPDCQLHRYLEKPSEQLRPRYHSHG
jgi:L-lactate dehydrogenase complex protein LldG